MMISVREGVCPLCKGTNSEEINSNVMACSGQSYKRCLDCRTDFVDTYLLSHEDENEVDQYDPDAEYDLSEFALEFDYDNPEKPTSYWPELINSKRYLFEDEAQDVYLKDYMTAEDIEACDVGVLSILDLQTKKIYCDGEWIDLQYVE